ncbi:MAG: aconitase family protein, partial [Promethearchaeota archaeon]
LYFSRPGNGICHQVHLERFARPGKTLLGSDSHTPTGGGVGMIAIGAGGLDVAAAMAGVPFRLKMPKIVNVYLTGKLSDFVSAKDVILEVLRRIGVKGAVNKVLEYTGPGIKTLSVPERGTITNMGTETGATTSIFPSDEITKEFLEAQGRGDQWIPLEPDEDAVYDEKIEINLSEIEPLVAEPHSPGNVKTVREIEGLQVDQVCIGSCTNSSLRDLKVVANILKGKTVAVNTVLTISPGSRQVVDHLIRSGEFAYFVEAGARILENACGPCIGMGLAPKTNAISLRTFNRNFLGRSGTKKIEMPKTFINVDNMIIPPLPPEKAKEIEIIRGPNIKPLPEFNQLPDKLEGEVLLKVEDDITTDHIMPAGAKILPLRSNIPEISKFVYNVIDPNFPERALEKNGGFIVGGENYGQGSSREHAAIAPKNLTKNIEIPLTHSLSETEIEVLKDGGKLPYIRQKFS